MAGSVASPTTSDLTAAPASTGRRAPRTRRLLSAFGLLAVLALLSGVLTSCETTNEDRAAVIDSINASRAQAGLGALRQNATLDAKADAWASRLRDECNIFHSNLADGAPPEWRKLGENVGRGGSIAQVHTAYLNSPGHRANILDPSYNQVGAGAVWGTCNGYTTVFTVQVFMRA
jgi:uncharacterized protein YkwD